MTAFQVNKVKSVAKVHSVKKRKLPAMMNKTYLKKIIKAIINPKRAIASVRANPRIV